MSSEEIFGAMAAGELERVRDLVAQDASCAGARNEQGISALMWALYNRRSDMADVVLDAASGVDVFEAAASGSTETVQALLQGGADVNAAQHGGWTALQAAAKHNNLEMGRVLLAAEADVARRVDDGQSALDLAEAEGHDEMVALLKAV